MEIVGVFFVTVLLLSLVGVAIMTACTITTVRKSFLEEQAEILKSNADDLEGKEAALEKEQKRLEYVMNQAQQAGRSGARDEPRKHAIAVSTTQSFHEFTNPDPNPNRDR